MDVAAVVRAHRADLLGPAFLLTGDERAGEHRVDRALARIGPADDHAAAVRALLRTRPPRHVVVEHGEDPWWVSAAELAAARRTSEYLDSLSEDDRVALVLDHEGLPADPDGLARARAGLPDPHAALAGLLGTRRAPVLEDDAAVARVRAHRRDRWRRPVAAVAAVAVLAVLAVVTARTAGSPSPANPVAGRLDGPTRGSLAGDAAFVDAARTASWDVDDAPAESDRRVLLAAELLDRRWVLVAGTTDDGTEGQWFTAPLGASAQELTPVQRPVVLRADLPAALLLDTELVVLAAPDEGVQVSPGQLVGSSGGVQRVYQALDLDDGVAALRLAAPDPGLVALRVQVVRVGEYSDRTLADVPVIAAGSADATAHAPALAPLRGADPDLGQRRAAVDAAFGAVTAPTGLDPGATQPTLVWAGQLPRPLGGYVDAAVVAVPQPSGALVVSTAWSYLQEDGTRLTIGCGSRAFPAGTDSARVAVAARCVVVDRVTGLDRPTVVLTTVTDTSVQRDDDRELTEVDGVPVTAAGPGDLFEE